MVYSHQVNDYFDKPQHVGSLDATRSDVGTGLVGAPACGDVMKVQIEVGSDGRITKAVFKAFGCKAAIASSELATRQLNANLTLDEALKISNRDIATQLALPPVKFHCSTLAEEAIKAAVDDYQKKQVALRSSAQ